MKEKSPDHELRSELLKIRQDYQKLKASYDIEISDRRQAEEMLTQQNNTLTKLNQFAIELSMLPSDGSMESLIVKRIKEIAGAKIAMFSDYDPVHKIITTDHIEMEPGLLKSFIELVGKGQKLRFDVSDEMYAKVTSEVIGVRQTFYDVSFGTIPRPVAAAMQAMLKVDRFIGIAYLIEGKLYGTSLLGMSKDTPDPQKQIMESFIFLSAVSLRRKKAEDALQKSYDMLEKLTAQVPGVVYQYRLWPDGRSAFPFASPGMWDIYEVTPEEVREDASPVFTRLHPDDFNMVAESISESARSQTLYHSEFRVILPEQGCRWRMCDAKPSKLDDGSTLWYGIISDITDRKLVEKELIHAKEKAEESDRLKSAFLANISHEIRTPMNGILGFAELLKEPDLTGEQQQEYIRIIEKSGDRMLNIINDIVDISKIESGQTEVVHTDTNINDQLGFIYAFFKPEADKKGLQLSFTAGLPAEQAVVFTDREKIYAILTNFVKNAVKYTQQGSIEFGYERLDGNLEFFVKDTGYGIPKERQKVIFERFVQAEISDNKAIQGAGLGLSIARAYVEMLGGEIRLESEPGKGSVFYFSIPFHPVTLAGMAAPDPDTETTVSAPLRKLKILIAEDDLVSDLLLTRVLRNVNSEMIHVKSGTGAVEAFRMNPGIDLVLMDIRMPDMDGYKAAREIRRFSSDVIIIAQTAYGLTGDREKALNAGCNEYLAKPVSKVELLEVIRRYFPG